MNEFHFSEDYPAKHKHLYKSRLLHVTSVLIHEQESDKCIRESVNVENVKDVGKIY